MRRLTATYRLQMNAGFTLSNARARVEYFARLGVSHLYCSPIFAARSGSTHGYDVVDPTRLNPELGTEDERAADEAVAELVAAGVARRQAAYLVARLTGVSRNRLYRRSL